MVCSTHIHTHTISLPIDSLLYTHTHTHPSLNIKSHCHSLVPSSSLSPPRFCVVVACLLACLLVLFFFSFCSWENSQTSLLPIRVMMAPFSLQRERSGSTQGQALGVQQWGAFIQFKIMHSLQDIIWNKTILEHKIWSMLKVESYFWWGRKSCTHTHTHSCFANWHSGQFGNTSLGISIRVGEGTV